MLRTDYQPSKQVVLAYPERFYNAYDELVPFYDELISILPNDINLSIITNNNQSIDKLTEKFQYKKINCLGIKGWDEIWVQDCLGKVAGDNVIKPKYQPDYCYYQSNHSYVEKINRQANLIIKEFFGRPIINLDLIIDGGNLVASNEYIFLTDKVLKDNSHLTKKEIQNKIQKVTGLTAIIIEGNKSDNIGHIDAYLTFIDNKTAVIPHYPSFPFLKDDIAFLKRLKSNLELLGFKLINIFDRPVFESGKCGCEKKAPCYYSARGNYTNFLRINDVIILPEYSLSNKTESNFYNKKNQEILGNLGFEVRRINCDLLSKLGGVLHCITVTA